MSTRYAFTLNCLGGLVSWAAMLTYFLVVPRWPDLRDAGWPNVVVGVAGVILAGYGAWLALRARRGLGAVGLFFVGAVPTAVLAFYVFFLSYQMPPPEQAIAVGETAPDFRLEDQNGQPRSLAEFQGKRIVLVFFRGHW